jgi:subtilase family serine protease
MFSFLVIGTAILVGCRPTAPSSTYDLLCDAFKHEPEMVRVGDKVTFTYIVKNSGSATIPPGSYTIDLYVDDQRVGGDEDTFALKPDGISMYSMDEGYYHFEATKPGIVKYRLVLDPNDTLKESDETNNVFEGTIEVSEKLPSEAD